MPCQGRGATGASPRAWVAHSRCSGTERCPAVNRRCARRLACRRETYKGCTGAQWQGAAEMRAELACWGVCRDTIAASRSTRDRALLQPYLASRHCFRTGHCGAQAGASVSYAAPAARSFETEAAAAGSSCLFVSILREATHAPKADLKVSEAVAVACRPGTILGRHIGRRWQDAGHLVCGRVCRVLLVDRGRGAMRSIARD